MRVRITREGLGYWTFGLGVVGIIFQDLFIKVFNAATGDFTTSLAEKVVNMPFPFYAGYLVAFGTGIVLAVYWYDIVSLWGCRRFQAWLKYDAIEEGVLACLVAGKPADWNLEKEPALRIHRALERALTGGELQRKDTLQPVSQYSVVTFSDFVQFATASGDEEFLRFATLWSTVRSRSKKQ